MLAALNASREELLSLINRDIPEGVDWKNGAKTYVASCFEKMGRENVEFYSMKKPLGGVGEHNQNPAIDEIVHYMNAFSNAISLIRPAHGARVLDLACGGGWVSHYLSVMGYWTYGIDISEDFIELAKKRLHSDSYLGVSPEEANERFSVLDIETERMPENLRGTFDFIWVESCLHHFVDPITALEHLAEALKPDGVLVLIEFENRAGVIKPEYMQVMEEFDTLERPYARNELTAALGMAGFSEHQFVGSINGWFRPEDPETAQLGQIAVQGANSMNLAICAMQQGRLEQYFPGRSNAERIIFGPGFYANENGFRWSAPSSELRIMEPIQKIDIMAHGSSETGQALVIYSKSGEKARVSLQASRPTEIRLHDLQAGEVLYFVSSHAFSPKWNGNEDTRILSFYLHTDE